MLVLAGCRNERGQLGKVLVDLIGAMRADLGVQVQLLALLVVMMVMCYLML